MRLIDADALEKRINKRLRKKGSFEGKDITELGYVILCIHEAETVDAEPVIRCKDCEYWITMEWGQKVTPWCNLFHYKVCRDADDFCSRREKK